MPPDYTMFASATTSRAAPTGNKRHKSSHHRGKTAKNKKKKIWSHFSPWDATKDSDCEDDDLVYFCRSRGISKTPIATTSATVSTAPQPTTRAQTTNQAAYNRDRLRRQTIALTISASKPKAAAVETASPKREILAPESRVPASLCASLKDKSKFVRESRGVCDDVTANGEDGGQKIQQDEKQDGGTKKELSGSPVAEDSESTSTECSSSKHSGDSLSKVGPNEDDKHGQLPQVRYPTCHSRASGDFVHQGASRKPAREWSADVETEIMRLYENSGPGSGLSILEAKSGPKSALKIKDQVESKLNNSDHTPSYVLALANLFRRRMQIRKEFSQVSAEINENSLRHTPPGPYSITNAFPSHKNSPRPGSHNPLIQSEEDCSPAVALRYHHVTTIKENSSNHQTTTAKPPAPKPGAVTFCSFATPLTTGIATVPPTKADKMTELEQTTDEAKPQSDANSDQAGKHVGAEESSGKPQTKETLENLLTVFPKPPQLKFSTGTESVLTKKQITSEQEMPAVTMNESPQREKSDSSTTSLIMSVAATRKKIPLPGKDKSTDDIGPNVKTAVRRRSDHKPLKPLGIARKCHSADLKQESSEHFKPQRCFDMPDLPPRRKVRDYLLFDKAKSLSNEETATLTPVTKVRWSGSLGTLYPKPKILGETVRCAAQADAISPRLMVNRLMSICDVTLSRPSNGKVKLPADCKQKNELMTVSPIDKQKSAVASL